MNLGSNDQFTDEESAAVKELSSKLARHSIANRVHEAYYDGSFAPNLVGISTPKQVADQLRMVAGWPGTSVDVLEERLDFNAFADRDLAEVFEDNALDEESSQVHLDTMIYGAGFVSVTEGDAGEPEQVVRGHDAKTTTGRLNSRTRRLDMAMTLETSGDEVVGVELWTPAQIVTAKRERDGQPWEVVDRLDHRLGRVPMVPFVNRSRTGDRAGKSEITAPMRRYADSAVRSLVAMDVNREFFSAPQRYAIGMNQDDFVGPNGERLNPWQIITGRVWMSPPVGEDEREPKLGQFDPTPPGPFLDQIEGLARLAAAEAGMPTHYLGLAGEQAASADAIRMLESRLVKKAERRQRSFGRSWADVGRLARALNAGVSAADVDPSKPRWGNAATPTLGATMDAMVKAVHAGLVEPGRVVWDRVGFTPEEQKQLEQALRQRQALDRAAMLSGASDRADDQSRGRARVGQSVDPNSDVDSFLGGDSAAA